MSTPCLEQKHHNDKLKEEVLRRCQSPTVSGQYISIISELNSLLEETAL